MTRKDYEAIAGAILAVRADIEARNLDGGTLAGKWQVTEEIAVRLCAVMRDDNPRFDRDKFLTACGL